MEERKYMKGEQSNSDLDCSYENGQQLLFEDSIIKRVRIRFKGANEDHRRMVQSGRNPFKDDNTNRIKKTPQKKV